MHRNKHGLISPPQNSAPRSIGAHAGIRTALFAFLVLGLFVNTSFAQTQAYSSRVDECVEYMLVNVKNQQVRGMLPTIGLLPVQSLGGGRNKLCEVFETEIKGYLPFIELVSSAQKIPEGICHLLEVDITFFQESGLFRAVPSFSPSSPDCAREITLSNLPGLNTVDLKASQDTQGFWKNSSQDSPRGPTEFVVHTSLIQFMDDGSRRPINNGDRLQSGDTYKLFVRAYQPTYLYAYQKDTCGNVLRIFPTKGADDPRYEHDFPHNPLPPGDTYLPRQTPMMLDHSVGKETFYLVASPEPNLKIESCLSQLDDFIDYRPDQPVQASQEVIQALQKKYSDLENQAFINKAPFFDSPENELILNLKKHTEPSSMNTKSSSTSILKKTWFVHSAGEKPIHDPADRVLPHVARQIE